MVLLIVTWLRCGAGIRASASRMAAACSRVTGRKDMARKVCVLLKSAFEEMCEFESYVESCDQVRLGVLEKEGDAGFRSKCCEERLGCKRMSMFIARCAVV